MLAALGVRRDDSCMRFRRLVCDGYRVRTFYGHTWIYRYTCACKYSGICPDGAVASREMGRNRQ